MAKEKRDIIHGIWGLFRVLLGITPLILIFVFGKYGLLLIYSGIGIILFIIGRYLKYSKSKNWVSDLTAYIILWPLLILWWDEFFKKEKPRTLLDEINSMVDSSPVLKLQRDFYALMNKNGTAENIIPNGNGRFGYDATNPIPTNSILGSQAYLEKLRDKDGKTIKYERLGSTFVSNISNPICVYKIYSLNDIELAVVYISHYQKTISNKAPEGFSII